MEQYDSHSHFFNRTPLQVLPTTMNSSTIRRFSSFFPSLLAIAVLLSSSSASAQLSSSQSSTMGKLAKLINNQTTILWDPKANPCSWHGVNCTSSSSSSSSPATTQVINLTLSNLGLNSSIFLPVTCEITTLESLDVSGNSLTSIPDGFFTACGKLAGLKALNFSRNSISDSLPDFSGFSSLESLDFSYNSFSGEIRMNLDALTGLKILNLTGNKFTGPIPVYLGKSRTLEQLQLSKNSFSGPIPEELADYTNLTLVDLSQNRLTGNLTTRIAELSKLETLVLSTNSLSGPIPRSLTTIKSLSRFAAHQNSFSGGIPSGFSDFLENLDLSFNSLTGAIPDDLLYSSHMQYVDLSSNRLTGQVPENISCLTLVRLRLGSNRLNGSLPSHICSKLPGLVYLELDNNTLTGPIPKDLGPCVKLQLLNLALNRFTGELPLELGSLKQLAVLELQENKLEGHIPTELTQLSELSTLNISSNYLSGTIPSSISLLQSLQYLDLQDNKLNGSIPANVSELNFLQELNLGKNQLGGEIPSFPNKLKYTLNLSYNLFQGPIPQSLQTLSALEVLDLSNNHFSGEIPKFLTDLESLIELLLANNNLNGSIPTFRKGITVITKPGNKDLVERTSQVNSHKKISIPIKIAIIFAAGVTGVVVSFVVVLLSRRFSRNRETKIESSNEKDPPHFLEGYLLTANSVHRANIDFGRALEAVSSTFNIIMNNRLLINYKVVMPSGARYLVKRLNWSDRMLQQASQENFKKELESLGKLNNSNIMVPLAYMLTEDSTYLFYEYAHKGTLFDILHSSLAKGIDWASRYSIAIGLSQGLAFLHGCSNGPVLLFDLSSKSIMLKSIKEPQIADIELCKVIDLSENTSSVSALAGSVGYVAPEYAYTMRITTAGNVYSFGVILLELLTGKPAVSEGIELAKWVLSNTTGQKNWDKILDLSISRTSPAVRSQMISVLRIALACVNANSEARPRMKSVPRMLLNAR